MSYVQTLISNRHWLKMRSLSISRNTWPNLDKGRSWRSWSIVSLCASRKPGNRRKAQDPPLWNGSTSNRSQRWIAIGDYASSLRCSSVLLLPWVLQCVFEIAVFENQRFRNLEILSRTSGRKLQFFKKISNQKLTNFALAARVRFSIENQRFRDLEIPSPTSGPKLQFFKRISN